MACQNYLQSGFFSCGSKTFIESTKAKNCRKISHMGHMGVSENRGTPKSSDLIGFSIINHPFWGIPIFGNTDISSRTAGDLQQIPVLWDFFMATQTAGELHPQSHASVTQRKTVETYDIETKNPGKYT